MEQSNTLYLTFWGVCTQKERSDKILRKRETCSSDRQLLKNGGDWKQVKGDELMVRVQRRLSEELDKYNPS